MSKGLIIAIAILTFGLACGALYTKIPVKVDKDYKVFVYSAEKEPIKEIPFKLRGSKHNGLISRDYFTGTIEVEGAFFEIGSIKDIWETPTELDTDNSYYARNPNPNMVDYNKQSIEDLKASIVISKDFKSIYGYTSSLRQKYGKGVYFKSDKNMKTIFDEGLSSLEESKRIALYVTAMEAAFKIENGGKDFIAVRMETLKGLNNEKAKENILEGLKELSPNVYDLEQVKGDKTKFEIDSNGNFIRAINGTVLSVKLKEYKDNEASIEVTSWFGNLGAVLPEYKANYKDGRWNQKLLG